MRKIDVIVPVYDGLVETQSCLESLLANIDYNIARIVVINDCSPNHELRAWMENLPLSEDFILLENIENLGFVATVNRGMAYSRENDVLLLNSDVIVANNWLERIQAVAYSQADVGTVTPFSNNATICSFPNFCEDNELPFGLSPKEMDECFSTLELDGLVTLPTAVGFCMYIKRQCLDEVGLFDVEAFGRGYGEENDFCVRAIAKQWINCLAPNVFVNHLGGVSFGAEKNERVQQAVAKLNQLHPGYDKSVHTHIAEDPAKCYRIEALLKLYCSTAENTVLFISHNLGGGVARHTGELSKHLAESANFLLLRPTEGNELGLHFVLSGVELNDSLLIDPSEDYVYLLEILRAAGVSHIHFHHIMGLPEKAWALATDLNCEYDITLHDYYLINSSPTHADSSGMYQADEAKVETQLPEGVSVQAWRRAQQAFIGGARHVIAPCESARAIYQKYYSDINIEVAYHPDFFKSPRYDIKVPAIKGRALRVGILGAISKEKGADWLESVALEASARKMNVEFVLIGYAYRPLGGLAFTTGPYQEQNLALLSDDSNIDVWWFPAIWPETYSYTLSHALDTGLPIVAPDMGAFTDRLRGRPLTNLLTTIDVDTYLAAFSSMRQTIEENLGKSLHWAQVSHQDFYKSRYLNAISRQQPPIPIDRHILRQVLSASVTGNKLFGEKVLIGLYRLRSTPVFSAFSRLVPFSVQRRIKRSLSRKPIHEILK